MTSRRGFSMIELVISVVIFAAALIPIADLMSASRRTTASSLRLLQATTYAQTLLEAVLPLDLEELPAGPTANWTLLSSMQPVQGGTGTRWTLVRKFFDGPPPFPMVARLVTARTIPNPVDPARPSRTVIRAKVEFLRVTTDEDSVQEVVLEGLLDPRP